jgi:metallothiol transferase
MMGTIEDTLVDVQSGKISRRDAVLRLGALIATASALPVYGSEEKSTSTFHATGLNHLALRVSDVQRSRDFYVKHLGLSLMRESSANAFLQCGESNFVALFGGGDPGMDHYCYTIDDYEPGDVIKRLKNEGFDPQRRENRVYFSDPDGLTVQLSGPRDAWPGRG